MEWIIVIVTLALAVIIGGIQSMFQAEPPARSYRSSYPSRSFNPDDISSYPTTMDIYKSGRFSAYERKQEYIQRGKSPSGVVDGEYNDTYLDDGEIYNDVNRDLDANA